MTLLHSGYARSELASHFLVSERSPEGRKYDRLLGKLDINAAEEDLIDAYYMEMPGTFELIPVLEDGERHPTLCIFVLNILADHPHLQSFEAFVSQLQDVHAS